MIWTLMTALCKQKMSRSGCEAHPGTQALTLFWVKGSSPKEGSTRLSGHDSVSYVLSRLGHAQHQPLNGRRIGMARDDRESSGTLGSHPVR